MAAFIQQPFPEQNPTHFKCPVPGCTGIDAAGYGLPCQRHACKRKTCPRPKAEGSAYCAHHACDLVACSKSRLDTSAFCNIHACQYSNCSKCKRGVGTPRGAYGDACEEHTCQANGCLDPRRNQRPYCPVHSCRWSGRIPCSQAIEAGSIACRDHVCRYEEGCANVRKVKSNSAACDDHTCAAPKCYGVAGIRGKYCQEHTCVWDPCSKRGGVNGTPFCVSHKCENPTCQAPVASKVDFFCEQHSCRYTGLSCRGGWLSSPPYCKDHTCSRSGCDAPVRRDGSFCAAHTCAFTMLGPNEQCLRGRRAGCRLCEEHSCTKCGEPRESPHSTRCVRHRKDDMHYMYDPRTGEKQKHRKRRGSPRGSSSSLEERVSGDLIIHEGGHKHKGVKARAPPPHRSPLSSDRAVDLAMAIKEPGKMTAASSRLDLIPSTFREDPNQSFAYGCGFRDACNHMADLMTMQMDTMGPARPMSPSRLVAKIDGPRFTPLADDGF